jgi:hypothetical protein
MTFSQAQYQALTDKIDSGLADLSAMINEVRPLAEATTLHWYIPGFVRDLFMDMVDEFVNAAVAVWHTIADLAKGAAAPILFVVDAYEWQDVRGLASGVASELTPNVLPSTRHWTGTAQQAYVDAVAPQSAAAARVGVISADTADALVACAITGLAFYAAIGTILAQYIATMAEAIAAFSSGAFSWVGIGLAVGDTSITAGLINAAVGSLVTSLGLQAQQMVSLHGQTADASTFPGGTWPEAGTASFGHAT